VEAFRLWLGTRPERCIAVVTHHGLLLRLTGHNFVNCELRSALLSDLAPEADEAAPSIGSSADSASTALGSELAAAMGGMDLLDVLMEDAL
jgi:hypothetical protein